MVADKLPLINLVCSAIVFSKEDDSIYPTITEVVQVSTVVSSSGLKLLASWRWHSTKTAGRCCPTQNLSDDKKLNRPLN